MNDQELYNCTISALFIKPGAGGAKITTNKKVNTFLTRVLFLFAAIFTFSLARVDAQGTAYIYVHQSTVDESSNPATGGFAYKATTTTVGALPVSGTQFTLNDNPATPLANSTFGTPTGDVGATSTGTLFAATPSGVFYRTVNSTQWNQASTTAASRIDGGTLPALITGLTSTDVAVFTNSSNITGTNANRGLFLYNVSANTTVKLTTAVSNDDISDVAYDRVNNRVLYIDDNTNLIYWAPVSATGTSITSAFKVVSNSYNNAYRLDIDNSGNIFYMDTNGGIYLIKSYTSSPTRTTYNTQTSLTTPHDVGCADDGSYFLAAEQGNNFGVFKTVLSGSTAAYTLEPQSGITFNITGGPAGQAWSTYYTNQIWTRLPGTTPNWFDDERVRTTTSMPANSDMIAVTIPIGSTTAKYVITQTPFTPTSDWNLQKINIYDSGTANTQSSSVSGSTATITVSAGEVVHVVFQNYFRENLAFANNCSTSSFSENFGTGNTGQLGALTASEIGSTSYHWYGTTKGSLNDGYYGACVQSSDVGYGSPNTVDHAASSTAAGGLNQGGKGNFLFFNASFQQDVFYQREFTGLVPGNPYTITYYLVNITGNSTVGGNTTLNPVNVTAFMADSTSGNILATAIAPTITKVGVWMKETFTFTPGAGQTQANFLLVNTGIGGNGNDIGLDDISFVLQPSAKTTATITNVCNGTSTIKVTSPLGSAYQYSINGTTWQTSPTFSGLATNTTYNVYSSYVGSSNCNSAVTVTSVAKLYAWSGAGADHALTTAANWVGGVAPSLTDENSSIEIPVVANGNYPMMSANAAIFSLQIDGAPANFNLNGFTLNVGCDIYNSTTGGLTPGTYPVGGILTSGTDVTKSTLIWDSAVAPQKYVGNSTAGSFKMANMTINNTYNGGFGIVTMSAGPMDIYNILTLSSGNLTVPTAATVPNTQLTLKSTATQSAALAQIVVPTTGATPSITASSVNVERFLTGGAGYRGYRLLSSPVWVNTVSGNHVLGLKYINTTVGSNLGALVGGIGGTANGFDVPNGQPVIYFYDETKQLNNSNYTISKNIGIYNFTSPYQYTTLYSGTKTPGITFPVANSYIFFFIGDTHSLVTSNTRVPENTTITATGTLNTGTIPFVLWTTKSLNPTFTLNTGVGVPGLQQVGNPYASSISLDKFYADNYDATNNPINPNFYELVEPGQNYVSYNASNGTKSSNKVGSTVLSGQGFIAGVTAANQTLTFYEDQKVNAQLIQQPVKDTAALFLSVKLPTALTGLHLQLTNDADTTQNTQTGIYYSTQWSDAYNIAEDATDLGGSAKVHLTSLTSDNIKVGINELGSYLKNKRTKLYVSATASGQYHIDMPDAKNIDTLYNIYLVDKLLKDSVNLRGDKRYDFAINNSDTTTFGTNRFELAVELKQMAPYQLLSFTGAKSAAGIQLQWKTANEGSFTGFTLQKQSGTTFIGIDSLQSTGAGAYSYTDIKPTSGVNTYRLMQNGITGNITYSDLVTINYNYLSSDGTLSIYPNPTRGDVNIYVSLPNNTYKINIYNSFGGVMKQQTVSGTYWAEDVTSYNAGTYIIEMTDNKGKFVGKTKFVKIK